MGKFAFRFPIRSGMNLHVWPQKIAKGLKLEILEEKCLYYQKMK